MRTLIVLCCIAFAAAKPSGFLHYGAPAAVVTGPVSVSSQYHAQDALGQYSYGYSSDVSSKVESKTFDGITRGGYSYVDGNGLVQSANYVADDLNGFNVAATNLPKHVISQVQDTPEVFAAKAAHTVAYNEAAVAAAVAPDVSESVVVAAPAVSSYIGGYVAPAVSSYVAPAVSVVKNFPSKSFSYSTVAASPAVSQVAVSPAVSHFAVSPVVSSRVAYDGVGVAPAVNVVKDVSSKAFSYSTVDASPVVGLNVASVPAAVSYSVGAEKIPFVKVEQNIPVVSVKSHVPVSAVSYSVPVGVGSNHQYHAQDALGQYSYGYSGGPSAKAESKTFDGVTRGGYSYVDGNGLVQSANYVSDDAHGFRVAATNLPIGPDQSVLHNIAISPIAVSPFVVGQQVVGDTPEVAAAKAAHFAAHEAAKYHHDYYYDY